MSTWQLWRRDSPSLHLDTPIFFASHRNGPEDTTNMSDMLLYRAEDVESHPELGFTPADLIFIALMSGGDYSVSGALLVARR